MSAQRKDPEELRERAVKMVSEIRGQDGKGRGTPGTPCVHPPDTLHLVRSSPLPLRMAGATVPAAADGGPRCRTGDLLGGGPPPPRSGPLASEQARRPGVPGISDAVRGSLPGPFRSGCAALAKGAMSCQ